MPSLYLRAPLHRVLRCQCCERHREHRRCGRGFTRTPRWPRSVPKTSVARVCVLLLLFFSYVATA